MTETIREQEYSLVDGGRVRVVLERQQHKSALRLVARHYSEDDARMAYAWFVVQDEEAFEARFQGGTHDDPTSEIVAAVHDFGYEIPNVHDSVLSPGGTDLDPIVTCLDCASFFRHVSDQTDSRFVSVWSRSLADLSEILAVNVFQEWNIQVEYGKELDESLEEVNDELLRTRLGAGPQNLEEVVSGLFKNAVLEKWQWGDTAELLKGLKKVYHTYERKTFLEEPSRSNRILELETDVENDCIVAKYEGRTFADETPSAVLRQVADFVSTHDQWT